MGAWSNVPWSGAPLCFHAVAAFITVPLGFYFQVPIYSNWRNSISSCLTFKQQYCLVGGLFSELILVDHPELATHLSALEQTVFWNSWHNVTLRASVEWCLERRAVAHIQVDNAANPVEEDAKNRGRQWTYLQTVREKVVKQCNLISSEPVRSQYIALDTLPGTSVSLERLFSAVKLFFHAVGWAMGMQVRSESFPENSDVLSAFMRIIKMTRWTRHFFHWGSPSSWGPLDSKARSSARVAFCNWSNKNNWNKQLCNCLTTNGIATMPRTNKMGSSPPCRSHRMPARYSQLSEASCMQGLQCSNERSQFYPAPCANAAEPHGSKNARLRVRRIQYLLQ
jgi:hypothetical protein